MVVTDLCLYDVCVRGVRREMEGGEERRGGEEEWQGSRGGRRGGRGTNTCRACMRAPQSTSARAASTCCVYVYMNVKGPVPVLYV